MEEFRRESCGEVFVGFFGHPSLRREDVFGQVVNEAAKVMQRGINVTQSVYERVKDRFQWVEAHDIRLKWKDVPFTVWRLAASSQ
jgi:class 3 adenylate cyclase